MLIVDPATGAMWKLDNAVFNETLSAISANNTEPSLKVFSYNEVPEQWKDKLVRIK